MGLPTELSVASSGGGKRPSGATSASSPGNGSRSGPELELTSEVLQLTEFGLHALEQFSRQEALQSVGMEY